MSIDRDTFIKMMLNHLPVEAKDETVLVRNLVELFKEIDYNGDGDLQWDEFTSNIIEQGMVKKDRVFVDAIKDYKPAEI